MATVGQLQNNPVFLAALGFFGLVFAGWFSRASGRGR